MERGRTTTGRSRPERRSGSTARSRRGTHRPGSRNEPSVRRRHRPADPGAAARHLQPGVRPPVPTDHRGCTGHLGVGGVDDCPHETPPSGFSVKVKGPTRVAEFRPRRRPAWTCMARTRRDRLAGHGDPTAPTRSRHSRRRLPCQAPGPISQPPLAARKMRETVSSPTVPEFGPNDWFLQERYQAFLADPASVDSIWRDFFAHTESSSAHSNPAAGHGIHATTSTSHRIDLTAAAGIVVGHHLGGFRCRSRLLRFTGPPGTARPPASTTSTDPRYVERAAAHHRRRRQEGSGCAAGDDTVRPARRSPPPPTT